MLACVCGTLFAIFGYNDLPYQGLIGIPISIFAGACMTVVVGLFEAASLGILTLAWLTLRRIGRACIRR